MPGNDIDTPDLSHSLVIIHSDWKALAWVKRLSPRHMEPGEIEALQKVINVPGLRVGKWFAVCPDYSAVMGEQGWERARTRGGGWVIVHLPSGMRVAVGIMDKETAIQAAEEIVRMSWKRGVEWRGKTVKGVEYREVVEGVIRKCGGGGRTVVGWNRVQGEKNGG